VATSPRDQESSRPMTKIATEHFGLAAVHKGCVEMNAIWRPTPGGRYAAVADCILIGEITLTSTQSVDG
jgi:hypothetical protein